jgi:hypothetical protein
VLEKKAANGISEHKKVRGGRRKLHNEELHNLHSSPIIITIKEVECI